jgi:hypothetical protein
MAIKGHKLLRQAQATKQAQAARPTAAPSAQHILPLTMRSDMPHCRQRSRALILS